MMKAKPKGRGNPQGNKKGKPKKVPGKIEGVAGKPPTRVRPVIGLPKKPGAGSKRKPVKGRRTFKRI